MSNSLELVLCETQGKIFEQSKELEFNSENFIKTYMKSKAAADMDKPFHHNHWAGWKYVLSSVADDCREKLYYGDTYDRELLYWIGYIYRFWHFYTGESSREIYKQAPAKILRAAFLSYHTMSPQMVVDRLKDTYKAKKAG